MAEEHPSLGLDEHDHERGEQRDDDRYAESHYPAEDQEHLDYPPMPDPQQQYGYYDDDSDRRGRSDDHHHDAADTSALGKIFVGGISWQTNEGNLRHHFEKFGELDDVALMTDKRTHQPRGFGFVTFKDPAVVDVVLQQEHVIDGRTVDVKRAVPKDEAPAPTRLESKKVFVGGLAPSVTETEFREYFEAYGPVKEAIVMYDRTTNRSRGFGFITFETEESVNKVMKDKQHEIMGKFVEVKRAEPRDARSGGGGREGGEREEMYGGMGMYGGRFPGMYGGPMRGYPYGYGRGGQYPPGFGMGYYGGFPSAYGMGGYGGRGMYGYGGGRGGGESRGGQGSSAPPREGSAERSTPSSSGAPRESSRDSGRSSQGRGPSGGPGGAPGGPQGGYGRMMGMMPMGYGYGYGGAYGMGSMYGGGSGQRQSQDPSFNETGYGGYRGQGASQGRADRSFRPY